MSYAIGLPGGPVRVLLETDDPRQVRHNLREGEAVVTFDQRPAGGLLKISGDGTALEAEDIPLSERRQARWMEARAWRETVAAGGCMTPLGRVDTDDASRQKISGAVQGAMLAQAAGQPFEVVWTMSDNGTVAHDAPAMIAMGLAVLAFVDACQRAGTAIRAAIEASDDPAAVDITAGYPVTSQGQADEC